MLLYKRKKRTKSSSENFRKIFVFHRPVLITDTYVFHASVFPLKIILLLTFLSINDRAEEKERTSTRSSPIEEGERLVFSRRRARSARARRDGNAPGMHLTLTFQDPNVSGHSVAGLQQDDVPDDQFGHQQLLPLTVSQDFSPFR